MAPEENDDTRSLNSRTRSLKVKVKPRALCAYSLLPTPGLHLAFGSSKLPLKQVDVCGVKGLRAPEGR